MTVPPPSTASYFPPPQSWFRLRTWLNRIFWWVVVLSFVGVIWALWYVNDRGFTRKWRRLVTTELAKRGIDAHIGRLTLNPLRGLVAKEVRINHPEKEDWVLAQISEVVLDIDYSGLVHGQPFVKAIDLRDAQLSLPVDPSSRESEMLEVTGLNARVTLPPNKLEFDAEANVQGLQITASGRLLNPASFRAAPKKSERKKGPRGLNYRILQTLRNLRITGGRPELKLECSGDLAHPSGLSVTGEFRSDRFTVDSGYEVRSARISASYAAGLLRLGECAVVDKLGELAASGMHRPQTGEATFHLRSTLDLQGLAHSLRLSRKVDEFAFYAPPMLEMNGELVLPPEGNAKEDSSAMDEMDETATPPIRGKVIGKFSVGRFAARSVMFEGAEAEFSWDGERWFVRGGRLAHRSGEVRLSALSAPEQFRVSLESGINPKVLPPLLPASAGEALRLWEFSSNPYFRFEGHAPRPGFDAMEGTGEVSFGASRFRGVGFDAFTSKVELKNGVLAFPDFVVRRPGEQASGAFLYDLKKEIATLQGVRSTLTPVDAAVWIDPKGDLPRHLAPYRFRVRPNLLIDGSVQVHGDDATRLRIDVDGRQLDYHFVTRDLHFPKIKGTLWVIKKRLKIENLDGQIFGGRLYGNADISLSRAEGDYRGDARVENVDFPSLTKLYLDYDASKGKLNGTYQFAGRGEEVRALHGKGEVSVSEGNVFGIPLFGPLSGILNEVLPGTGYNTARRASATFEMKDGEIDTRDLVIEGKGFSMFGGGKLFFLDDKIDFSIRINAQGPAGVLFTPVSHLFEYVSDGSLSKPVWRPKRLPRAMFRQP